MLTIAGGIIIGWLVVGTHTGRLALAIVATIAAWGLALYGLVLLLMFAAAARG